MKRIKSQHSPGPNSSPLGAALPSKRRRDSRLLLLPLALLAALCAAAPSTLRADGSAPPFDLTGPAVRVQVTRGGVTLPISSVPSLRAGDKLWIQPDFPADQSAHYLLIAAFLQGTTNPPPDSWFTRVETWQKQPRERGTTIEVPVAAQQALLFLAPDTAGAFESLRNTVRGKPGIFVRAAQDLEQASLDRSRLDKFLEEIRKPSPSLTLANRAALLTRTLAVKADPQCFDRPVDEQSTCLAQNTGGLTLQETPNQSFVASLTSGASADLVGTFSASPIAKAGYYSPYIGSAMDIVRLLDGLRTAQFQYLPALASPAADYLQLKLNAPPSFRTPRSVLVVALPGVAPPGVPPLHALDAAHIDCLQNPGLVLAVEGAPLVFSTTMAHDFTLRLEDKFGQPVDLPAYPDAARGGFTIDASALESSRLDGEVRGTLFGSWGFEPYQGPSFRFQNARPAKWAVSAEDAKALAIGRSVVLHLTAGNAACVEQVSAKIVPAPGSALPGNEDTSLKATPNSSLDSSDVPASGAASVAVKSDTGSADKASDGGIAEKRSDARSAQEKSDARSDENKPGEIKPTWHAPKPDELDVELPLQHASPGALTLSVQQFGARAPDVLILPAYGAPARPAAFALSAGDTEGVLTGAGLDQVSSLELAGVHFAPGKLSRAGAEEQLAFRAPSAAALAALPAGSTAVAHLGLKDGRVLALQTAIEPGRPKVALLSKSVQLASSAPSVQQSIHLGDQDELPQDGRLSFLLKTEIPDKFPHSERIEVATVDGSSNGLLSAANGGLVLQDSQNVLVILDPLKTLGPSAFGPLQFRPVSENGQKGDWQPLARLVRVPALTDVHCPQEADKPCMLAGSNLFLLDSVSADPAFADPVAVPPGYAGGTLAVPRPTGAQLYIRLRDDPAVVSSVSLPVLPDPY